jgi:diaminopimelate decarboxylase
VWPATAVVGPDGRLRVGGCVLSDLAADVGTPSYVVCRATLRAACEAWAEAFGARASYATKANPARAVLEVVRDAGLAADASTGGELAAVLGAGFEPARIVFHGNNRSADELAGAVEAGVGLIAVDNDRDIDILEAAVADGRARSRPRVLVRLTPNVEPHTHAHVATGQADSKFGFPLAAAEAAIARARRRLDVVGLHAHVGSMLFDLDLFEETVDVLAPLMAGVDGDVISVGGGIGAAHLPDDPEPPGPQELARRLAGRWPGTVLVEPGRALVARAGVTVYAVGNVRRIPDVNTYVAVDGGMGENPRVALYDARYEARLADRPLDATDVVATVVGKHCESGDVIARGAALPWPEPGEILVTPATGAYHHAMASTYNLVPRPPLVMVEDGRHEVVVRRERLEDLFAREVPGG